MKKLDQTTWKSLQQTQGFFLIFKHSTTCPVSAAAYAEVADFVEQNPEILINLLVVQDEPALKMQIAEDLQVAHESPQIIVVHNQQIIRVLNHYDISRQSIENAVNSKK